MEKNENPFELPDRLEVLVVDGTGLYLGRKGDRIQVRKGKEVIEERSLMDLDQVIVIGERISISADIIEDLCKNGIHLGLADFSGKPYGLVSSPFLHATVALRRAQFAAYENARSVKFAKTIIAGKIRNQRNLLLHYSKGKAGDSVRVEIRQIAAELKKLETRLKSIEGEKIDKVRNSILGIEGAAAKFYWGGFSRLVADRYEFPGRTGRGARDPVNSFLNYGYGILYSTVWMAVTISGLEPFAGFLHADRSGKPSLVLDLIEEFRSPIVDRSILTLVRRSQPLNFDDGNRLAKETRRLIADQVLDTLSATAKYKGRNLRYRSIICAQARSLGQFLRKGRAYRCYAFKW